MSEKQIIDSLLPLNALQKRAENIRSLWADLPGKLPAITAAKSINDLVAELPDPETIPSEDELNSLMKIAEETESLCAQEMELLTKIIRQLERLSGA